MSVRFGAGANYANKHNAPFRVLDNGKMIAQDADITGKIIATGGKIGDWEINGSSLGLLVLEATTRGLNIRVTHFFSRNFLIRKNGSERGETKEVMMVLHLVYPRVRRSYCCNKKQHKKNSIRL
ncbi:hypothetical protein [Riemerella anatipestifer]|uniref:hypothetical protein n=1 Tax=Riemerella anatipestifer TaxID=34085 RepID=UPI0011233369|nr:hypothetical protein [Riemerella anatipestifer]QDE19048.1 hypothetical protein FIP52_00755 [Riemerella anatipestifer]